MSEATQVLRAFIPTKEFFIGIDSDGCVFDAMEIKHKQCFGPMFIKHLGLEPVRPCAEEVWNFVNLYSRTRGANRFQALVRALNLLRERREVVAAGFSVPGTVALEAWVARETALSNATLRKEIEGGNQALAPVLAWSHAVNQAVERTVTNVPPLPYVRECLQKMGGKADRCVVTQTPTEALVREWEQHDIRKHVELSAGQELGTKTDHLRLAAGGKYPLDHILMIGDALGDLNAAKANRALFYPIMPGREAASWERLYRETLDRFFAGTYAGACEDELIREFEASLPEKPNW
jgi:phosphoglycolate phosphatase-like HAD superfamily hydrolase